MYFGPNTSNIASKLLKPILKSSPLSARHLATLQIWNYKVTSHMPFGALPTTYYHIAILAISKVWMLAILNGFLALSLFLYFHFFWEFFPRLTSNCPLILWKKEFYMNFENFDIAKFRSFFWKSDKFWWFLAFFSLGTYSFFETFSQWQQLTALQSC